LQNARRITAGAHAAGLRTGFQDFQNLHDYPENPVHPVILFQDFEDRILGFQDVHDLSCKSCPSG